MSERNVLLERARIVIGLGGMLCVAAGIAVVVPRQLGLIGNVYVRDNYFSNGTYLWVATRGIGWLISSAVLSLVAIPVIAAGIREYRRERQTRDVLLARTVRQISTGHMSPRHGAASRTLT